MKQHIEVNCSECGKKFELSQMQRYSYKKDPTKEFYCSVQCRNKRLCRKNTQERPKVNCCICGKEITLSNDQLHRYNKGEKDFYCSQSCIMQKSLKNINFKKRSNTLKDLLANDEYRQARTLKTFNTNLEKYGTRSVFQLDEIKQKALKSKLEKYGDSNYNNRNKAAKTYYNHYGIKGHSTRKISKLNMKVADFLGFNEFEFPLENYNFDLKKDNILIEIDPSYTHHSLEYLIKGKYGGLDPNYHKNKTIVAEKYGYRCIHIFDWDDLDKIKYLIQDKKNLYARKLKINEVSKRESDLFLDNYHLQGTCRGQEIRLGLYLDNKLIQIMTFGKPRYNRNYQYELLRLCTDKDYKVVGGAEKLFKYFIKTYNPQSIISYCDHSKFRGDIYITLGFKKRKNSKPNKHWSKRKDHITDNLLRQRGYDQLFGANYGKGTSNEQLMIENYWLPIYDCGQDVYIWKR